jgi:small subunit ribosomal protein S8
MLTRLRNANTAMHDDVTMPSSKLKEALASVLQREGYITDFNVMPASSGPGNRLTITLKYSPERERTISGIRRVSKPGLRVYAKAQEMPRVLGGLGIAIISTSQGLLTDRQARKRNVGGEVLAWVW